MKKAFTLIELLIVIAIIGILAGIVLVSLTGALKKAKDSRIQGDLQQVRQVAGMIMSDSGNYDTLCSASTSLNISHPNYATQLNTIQTDIRTQQGGTLTLTCYGSGNDFCVSARLVSTTTYYCVDSQGDATVVSTDRCAGSPYTCR
jgi:prepilin-type N-terminal cleavage/methylation domain-containing protein